MSRRLHDGDILSGAVLGALGIYVVAEARVWTYYGSDGPGPAFFPIIQGIALVGLSLLLIIRALRQSGPANKNEIDWTGTGRALGTWAAFAGCIALMEALGFLLAFALLTFFLVVVIFKRPLLVGAATAIGCALAFYVTFPFLLGLSLPTGPLGF
jgi:putative tricarboxylic transport membrane protein